MPVPFPEWQNFLTETLSSVPYGRIAIGDVWRALGKPAPVRGIGTPHVVRVNFIMRALGWRTQTDWSEEMVMTKYYIKGPPPRRTIYIHPDNPAAGTCRASYSTEPSLDERVAFKKIGPR